MTVQGIDANHRSQGVHGVPHYVFNGRVAVAGVQDTDTLITALDYALFQPLPEIGDRAALH
jgi:predicted DsbA family dithiol-disulfide isomerase